MSGEVTVSVSSLQFVHSAASFVKGSNSCCYVENPHCGEPSRRNIPWHWLWGPWLAGEMKICSLPPAGTTVWNQSMRRAILQWINSMWCCKLAVIAWLRWSLLESEFIYGDGGGLKCTVTPANETATVKDNAGQLSIKGQAFWDCSKRSAFFRHKRVQL